MLARMRRPTGVRLALVPTLLALSGALSGCGLLGLAGAGQASGQVAPVSPAVTTPPGSSTPTPAASAGGLTLTVADSGETVRLPVARTLTLDLQGSLADPWGHLGNSNPAVLRQLSSELGILQPAGTISARFLALAPGTAVIHATQIPSCTLTVPACAMPDRLFSVTVVVAAD